jgi:hypothetical protein
MVHEHVNAIFKALEESADLSKRILTAHKYPTDLCADFLTQFYAYQNSNLERRDTN